MSTRKVSQTQVSNQLLYHSRECVCRHVLPGSHLKHRLSSYSMYEVCVCLPLVSLSGRRAPSVCLQMVVGRLATVGACSRSNASGMRAFFFLCFFCISQPVCLTKWSKWVWPWGHELMAGRSPSGFSCRKQNTRIHQLLQILKQQNSPNPLITKCSVRFTAEVTGCTFKKVQPREPAN